MTPRNPLVTAVIPSYNHGIYVCETVESALSQTYPNVEVLVVDDGSTDDTRERLQPYANRIRYIYQENAGLSAARNAGIQAASGEWIALLDADDLWHPRKTEVQLRAIVRHSDAALVGSQEAPLPWAVVSDNPIVSELGVRDFLLSSRTGTSGALIKKSCVEAVGYFDVSLRAVEDRDMWLRLAAKFKCVLVQSPCWWYRRHEGQMNRHADRMFVNYRRVLEKFFEENPQNRDLYRLAMGYLYMDSAWSCFEEQRRLAALTRLAGSAWYRPINLGDGEVKTRFLRCKLALRALLGRIGPAASS